MSRAGTPTTPATGAEEFKARVRVVERVLSDGISLAAIQATVATADVVDHLEEFGFRVIPVADAITPALRIAVREALEFMADFPDWQDAFSGSTLDLLRSVAGATS